MCACPSVSEDSGPGEWRNYEVFGQRKFLKSLSVKKSLSVPRERLMPSSSNYSTQASNCKDGVGEPFSPMLSRPQPDSFKIANSRRLSTPKRLRLGSCKLLPSNYNRTCFMTCQNLEGALPKKRHQISTNVEENKLLLFQGARLPQLPRIAVVSLAGCLPSKNYDIQEPTESFFGSCPS